MEIAFVAGDLGAANAMVPVMRELAARGRSVVGVADSAGVAETAFQASGLPLCVATGWHDAVPLREAQLLVVGTSASATGLERVCAVQAGVRVAMFSDSYFNHANPVWRAISARWWLAIDEAHAANIYDVHPGVEEVIVCGQPVFDDVLALMPRKQALRRERRGIMALGDTPLAVWWSTGIGSLAAEDLAMAEGILEHASRPLALACMMHPKLAKTVGTSYIQNTRAGLASAARAVGIRWVEAESVPGIELCLSADVLVSVTCTEDIKSTLIGGPPVVHLLGPDVRRWMEADLLLAPPHYLPDIATGLSIGAHSPGEVAASVGRALVPAEREVRAAGWRPPTGGATERTADVLERLTSWRQGSPHEPCR